MSAYLLDRVRPRRMPEAVAQLLSARWYEERLSKLAADLGRGPGEVLPEAIIANRLTPALTYGGANMNFLRG